MSTTAALELLCYDPATGIFRWRCDRANQRAGQIAGNVGPNGYRTICVNYTAYYAHHLALLFSTGSLPPKGNHVDHIDGDRLNNSLSNLRIASPSLNGLNRKLLNRNNRSGATGVWQNPRSGQFHAQIMVDRKTIRLGRFKTFEEAVTAREAAHAIACR